jgi:S-DNA-T family DNA segregation ATPase FtsK/SpoIIIE
VILGSVVVGCGREAWFWLTLPFRVLRRHRGLVLTSAGVAVVPLALGYGHAVRVGLVGLVVVVAVLRCWWHLDPASFELRLAGRYRRRLIRGHVLRSWPVVCQRAGLTFMVAAKRRGEPAVQIVPQLQARWVVGRLCLSPQMLAGHDLAVWETAAEAVRVAAGASRVELRANNSRTGVQIWLAYGDALTVPFSVEVPELDAPVSTANVSLGRTEDGGEFSVRLGVHTLVAGATGAGKASAVHGLLIGLGPAIRTGVVQVHGIDLKGGMELGMARPCLTRCATTPAQAVIVLEEAAAAMAARASRLAGHTRTHEASVVDPLVVVLVDELAAITAYLNDRDLKNRAATALSLLLSQGRAVGYMVVACLQDPRKEVIPMRGLFTQTLGLRLRDSSETDMVVGAHARHVGAACELIPATLPGVGWMVPDSGGQPVRFRLGHVTDADIRSAARRFPAAARLPITLPEPTPGKPRASRAARTTVDAA